VSHFRKIKKKYGRFDIKSPVEKCLEILSNAKEVVDNNLMLKDIEWLKFVEKTLNIDRKRCMQMIASNKLYLPILEKNLSKENNEKTQEVIDIF